MPQPLPKWLPPQDGRLAVITGANSGIGYEAARLLAAAGGRVVLACRRPDSAQEAVEAIQSTVPGAQLDIIELDLADQSSIASTAAQLRETLDAPIDFLINNAGVMAPPSRQTTVDGFELQLGVNHLGHFAWTMRLIDLLAPAGRVVQVASIAHRFGRMYWDDLHGARSYNSWRRYGQSKLANLLFVAALDRRLAERKLGPRAVGCHPGYAATKLQTHFDIGPSVFNAIKRIGNVILAQSAAAGAEPTVYAATSPQVRGGNYIGPSGLLELMGSPVKVGRTHRARDEAEQDRLWAASVEATGLDLP